MVFPIWSQVVPQFLSSTHAGSQCLTRHCSFPPAEPPRHRFFPFGFKWLTFCGQVDTPFSSMFAPPPVAIHLLSPETYRDFCLPFADPCFRSYPTQRSKLCVGFCSSFFVLYVDHPTLMRFKTPPPILRLISSGYLFFPSPQIPLSMQK